MDLDRRCEVVVHSCFGVFEQRRFVRTSSDIHHAVTLLLVGAQESVEHNVFIVSVHVKSQSKANLVFGRGANFLEGIIHVLVAS